MNSTPKPFVFPSSLRRAFLCYVRPDDYSVGAPPHLLSALGFERAKRLGCHIGSRIASSETFNGFSIDSLCVSSYASVAFSHMGIRLNDNTLKPAIGAVYVENVVGSLNYRSVNQTVRDQLSGLVSANHVVYFSTPAFCHMVATQIIELSGLGMSIPGTTLDSADGEDDEVLMELDLKSKRVVLKKWKGGLSD